MNRRGIADEHRAENAIVGEDSPCVLAGKLADGVFAFSFGNRRPHSLQFVRPDKAMFPVLKGALDLLDQGFDCHPFFLPDARRTVYRDSP